MSAFFTFLREIFEAFLRNFLVFLQTIFVNPWVRAGRDFSEYSLIFKSYNQEFGVPGWIFFIIFILLILALLGSLGYLIYYLVRRYILFRRQKVKEQALVDEIQKLNRELFFAIQEKNEILKLKAESMGLEDPSLKSAEDEEKLIALTYPKLAMVDKMYENKDTTVVLPDIDSNITLEQLVNRFRNFASSQLGLYYNLDIARAFFAGMGTTKLIILEGISGTGKTSLPYAVGKFFKNDITICSVQPSWRDRSELLGYYNEFTKRFNESEFLKAVYEASYRHDNKIVLLDEMNLARIEYYFAEFLSIMELPNITEWQVEVTKSVGDATPKNLKDGKLLISQNLWFVGTANNDDSTFTITDKVYDRAIAISLNDKGQAFDAEFTEGITMPTEYFTKLYAEAQTNYPLAKTSIAKFSRLDAFVTQKFRISFGNRIMKQISIFVPNYVACGGSENEALDFMFSTKILKKFNALNLAFLHDELKQLTAEIDKIFGKNAFKQSQGIIQRFLERN